MGIGCQAGWFQLHLIFRMCHFVATLIVLLNDRLTRAPNQLSYPSSPAILAGLTIYYLPPAGRNPASTASVMD